LRHQLQDVFGCSLDFRSSRSELGESVLARLHFQVMDGDEAAVATARVDRLIGHAFPGWAIIFPIDLDRQPILPLLLSAGCGMRVNGLGSLYGTTRAVKHP